ncbi:hypothetical protein D3C87_687310 [compost metagenome]
MAKTFTVNMRCDNAAFDDAPEAEIARILREMADSLESRGASGFFETIHDINGNDVGRYALKETQGE